MVKSFANGTNGDYKIEVVVKGEHLYQQLVDGYEQVKYADVDYSLKPSKEKLEQEFEEEVLTEFEFKFADGEKQIDYITFGFRNNDNDTNEFMEIKVDIENPKHDEYRIRLKSFTKKTESI